VAVGERRGRVRNLSCPERAWSAQARRKPVARKVERAPRRQVEDHFLRLRRAGSVEEAEQLQSRFSIVGNGDASVTARDRCAGCRRRPPPTMHVICSRGSGSLLALRRLRPASAPPAPAAARSVSRSGAPKRRKRERARCGHLHRRAPARPARALCQRAPRSGSSFASGASRAFGAHPAPRGLALHSSFAHNTSRAGNARSPR
jgi:hypothetical protein